MNRGWVPESRLNPASRQEGQVSDILVADRQQTDRQTDRQTDVLHLIDLQIQ